MCIIPISWLVDTGAAPNVLNWNVYNRLHDITKPTIRESNCSLYAAGGEKLKVYGETDIEVCIGRSVFTLTVVVADLENLDGILGMKFLTEEMCIFDAYHGSLQINGMTHYMQRLENQSQVCRIRLSESVTVKSGHEQVLIGEIDKRWNSDNTVGITEATDSFLKTTGLLMCDTVVEPKLSKVILTCTNLNDEPVRVNKGTTIGLLQPIANIIDVNSNDENTVTVQSVDELPDYLQDLAKRASEGLNTEQTKMMCDLLSKNSDVFVGSDEKIGRTNLVKHRIHTGSAPPIKQRPYKVPISQRHVIDEQIDSMLKGDQIEPSESPWASPVVLVEKKDRSFRFCVDYRKLNSVTTKDSFPLANINDCLDSLSGTQWFSTLDLASGYWQCEVAVLRRSS